jgi:hypothetical protein
MMAGYTMTYLRNGGRSVTYNYTVGFECVYDECHKRTLAHDKLIQDEAVWAWRGFQKLEQ